MPLRRLVYRFFILTMYFSGGLIAVYLLMRRIGLYNNFFVYIVPGIVAVFNVILVKTYIEQLPSALEDSAKIDGANYFTIYVRIVFPLSLPILATIAVFGAVGQWNSWWDNLLYVRSGNCARCSSCCGSSCRPRPAYPPPTLPR